MAVQSYFPTQEDKNPQSSTGSAVLGGGGSTPAAAPAAKTGTGFVNLQKYIQTNKDTGGLANAVTGQAGSGIQDFQQQTQQGASNITSNLQGQTANLNQQAGDINAAWRNIGQDFQNRGDAAISDYLGRTRNANFGSGVDTSGFNAQTTANANRLNQTQDLAQNSQYAQQALLGKEFGGKSGYNPTFGALDALILGQTNRAGLEAGLAGNRQRVADTVSGANAQVAAAQQAFQNAQGTLRGAAAQGISQSDRDKLNAARDAGIDAYSGTLAQAQEVANRLGWGGLNQYFGGLQAQQNERNAAQARAREEEAARQSQYLSAAEQAGVAALGAEDAQRNSMYVPDSLFSTPPPVSNSGIQANTRMTEAEGNAKRARERELRDRERQRRGY